MPGGYFPERKAAHQAAQTAMSTRNTGMEFIQALEELEAEKGIDKGTLLDAVKTALVSAYKRHYGNGCEARVEIDPASGEIKVISQRSVVSEYSDDVDPCSEILLEDARAIKPDIQVGEILEEEVPPEDFGRISAQTAKQVVVQRIREAERGLIYDKYAGRENELLTAVVHRLERGDVFVEVDRAEGVIPAKETVPGERYGPGDRIKVYVREVKKTNKGAQIVVSRACPGLIKKLFELEVPEIVSGIVEVKSIAREAGARTKIAVASTDKNVDPVGACVGPKGTRIERVVDELNGEKIDVIPWSSDPIEFIANALRPAKVLMVQINEADKAAKVIVPDYQLSLAIGKEGQNARLAAKLTGWKIDIKSKSQSEQEAFGSEFAEQTEDAEEEPVRNEFDVIDALNDEEAVEEAEEDLILDTQQS